jgi:uncharacterized membrane protein YkvA (DUF1232 family)
MSDIFDLCGKGLVVFTILVVVTLWFMHQPDSPLKTIALRGSAAVFALIAPAYVLSPVDVMPEAILGPFGLVDDLAAAIAGFLAARYAIWGPKVEEAKQISGPGA